jgi:hypothetical protein
VATREEHDLSTGTNLADKEMDNDVNFLALILSCLWVKMKVKRVGWEGRGRATNCKKLYILLVKLNVLLTVHHSISV